ncbi:MAG: hypothetical protein LKF36_07830 [Lactobacillus sp.]|jgi:hypothetical protein|nr:hypothetical protein [Lactobacillus sp.]
MFKKIGKKYTIALAIGLAVVGIFSQKGVAQADADSDIARINAEYQSLDRTSYDASNAFTIAPHNTSAPFSVGQLNPAYINKGIAYWNFFRDMYGMPRVYTTSEYNELAQFASACLTATGEANLWHGFDPSIYPKPDFISQADWKKGSAAAQNSNLAQIAYTNDVGGTVETLFGEKNNGIGNNTGHRAAMLYWDLKGVGIGNTYAGSQYGSNTGVVSFYLGDRLNSTYTEEFDNTTYPNKGVFPIQYAVDVPWSIYSGTDKNAFRHYPSITVKNNTTGQTGKGINLNSDDSHYGFQESLSFRPSGVDLRSGDEYTVTVHNMAVKGNIQDYSYSFKLFTLGDDTSSHQYDVLDKNSHGSDDNQGGTTNPNDDFQFANGKVTVNSQSAEVFDDYHTGKGTVVKSADYGSQWVYSATALDANGTKWYLIGDGAWISSDVVTTGQLTDNGNNNNNNGSANNDSSEQAASGISTVISPNGAQLYDTIGQRLDRRLDYLSAWRFSGIKNIGGTNYYAVGENAWLKETDILNAGYSFPITAKTQISYGQPVGLWSQPTWNSAWVKSVTYGTAWQINRFTVDSQGNLWFDLGSGAWMPAVYGTPWQWS